MRHPVSPDAHGALPRLPCDDAALISPTTRGDVLAWCHQAVEGGGAAVAAANAGLCAFVAYGEGRCDAARVHDIAARVLRGVDAAADDIFSLVREFGYDPTRDRHLRRICDGIVMARIQEGFDDVLRDDQRRAGDRSAAEHVEDVRNVLVASAIVAAVSDMETGSVEAAGVARMKAMTRLALEEVSDDSLAAVLTNILTGLEEMHDHG